MQHRMTIVVGGLSLVVAAFVLVFSYLAANFDYPGILDGSAAEVLPRLSAGGGEFLGEACLASFFVLAGLSTVDEARFPRWLG